MLRARLTVLVGALATVSCGGSSSGTKPVVVVPAPSIPTPTPTPAASPNPGDTIQALNCTVHDTVRQSSSFTIKPVAGTVTLVAIGSSSTAGLYASSPSATYPAVLQQLLSTQPGLAVYAVYNKGVNGDTLAGTQARLQHDVLDLRPQLVILQAGTNDALIGQTPTSLSEYAVRLRSVVTVLKAQTSVVLMNSQHFGSEPSAYADYQGVTATVAMEQNVPLFDRYGLMKSWIASGKYRYADMLASDGFHPNDTTYRCMAQVVAELTLQSTRD